MGGQVDLRHGELRWTLSATGPRLVFDPAFWNILAEADTTPDLSAGMVQFALAGEAAQALGRSIVVDAGEEDLEVSF